MNAEELKTSDTKALNKPEYKAYVSKYMEIIL